MGYWLLTEPFLQLLPDDLSQPEGSIYVDEDSPEFEQFLIPSERADLIEELKAEALTRIQAHMPLLTTVDAVETLRELWLSILPAAKDPTPSLAAVIANYQAARSAILTIRAFTNLADVRAYDVVNDPSWP